LRVRLGVDVFLEDPEGFLGGARFGLVTNPSGVTGSLEPTLEALQAMHTHLRAVFGPEHGAAGAAQDAVEVPHATDLHTGLPVYSLYGETRKPTAEMLDGLEALVFDIQDVGSRYYTYVSTMALCMEACEEHGLEMLVLDRPNPLNGVAVEGGLLEPGYTSFVGWAPTPIRHGLTVGELSLLLNEGVGCRLRVAEMEGWVREMWFDETCLQWVAPSPNMPTLETATVYPGTCLVEGVNLSEGRGTTKPFEVVGAPWLDGRKLARHLNKQGLEGVVLRPCCFTPVFSKYAGQLCQGVQLHVVDRASFKPVETGLRLLAEALAMHPEEFRFLEPSYDSRPHFDLLVGNSWVRQALLDGVEVGEIVEGWRDGLEAFKLEWERFQLYGGRGE